MHLQFSQKLIEETIKVFREEDGLELSPEQANEYLKSLAGLFLAFAGGRERPSSLEADGTPPSKVDNRGDSILGVSNT